MSPSSTRWADWNVSKTPVHVGVHSGLIYIWETMELSLCMQGNPSHATLPRQQQCFLSQTQTVWSREQIAALHFLHSSQKVSKCCKLEPVLLVKSVCLSSLRSPSWNFQWVSPAWGGQRIWMIWVRTSGSLEQLQALLIHQTHSEWCFPTNHSNNDFNVFLAAWNIVWTDLKLYISHNNIKVNQKQDNRSLSIVSTVIVFYPLNTWSPWFLYPFWGYSEGAHMGDGRVHPGWVVNSLWGPMWTLLGLVPCSWAP